MQTDQLSPSTASEAHLSPTLVVISGSNANVNNEHGGLFLDSGPCFVHESLLPSSVSVLG